MKCQSVSQSPSGKIRDPLYTTFQKIFTIIKIFLKSEAPKALYSSHSFIVSALIKEASVECQMHQLRLFVQAERARAQQLRAPDRPLPVRCQHRRRRCSLVAVYCPRSRLPGLARWHHSPRTCSRDHQLNSGPAVVAAGSWSKPGRASLGVGPGVCCSPQSPMPSFQVFLWSHFEPDSPVD